MNNAGTLMNLTATYSDVYHAIIAKTNDMNTLENKAKFFAQYWGQQILCIDGKKQHKNLKVGKNWLYLWSWNKETAFCSA